MPKMTVEIRTDVNGFFSKTVHLNPPGPFGLTVRLSATLLSPFATGLWGSLDIDAQDGNPSNQTRAFVAWHNECPHRQGPVCQGRIYKRVLEPIADDGTVRALAYDESVTNIVCSWHGYEFDLKTGINQGSPRFRLRAAKLDQKDGNIYVVL